LNVTASRINAKSHKKFGKERGEMQRRLDWGTLQPRTSD